MGPWTGPGAPNPAFDATFSIDGSTPQRQACVLLVGHGSRDARANAEIESLAELHRRALPGVPVELGYIELARPLLSEALERVAASARQVVVVPLFLFASGHVKNDIPLAVEEARRKFPRTDIRVTPCLGVHPKLVSTAFDRAGRHIPEDARARARTAVVVVGRGSSDPDSNADFYKVARLLGEGRGLLHVEPAFSGIARPSVEDSLALVARLRPEAVVVVPYLLTAGRLLEKLRTQLSAFAATHPWIRTELADHLGVDSRLVDLVRERTEQALAGQSLLPCDNCQYRTPLAGFAGNVGGLRALLYSVRHTFTHAQATPLGHTHRPIKKHVLVCGNTDCVDRGSIGVLEAFRRCVKDAGRTREIRVTRTSCMGRCGEGPTVAVYPDGIWYRRVAEGDAAEIYRDHLLGDRLVSRLVSDILQ